MPVENLGRLSLLGLAVAVSSSLVSWNLFGQSGREYAENVPLTYTLLSWRASTPSPDDLSGEEVLKSGARRSDGSSMLTTYAMGEHGHASVLRVGLDLENARYLMLDSSLKSVTSAPLSEQAVDNYRNRRLGCDDGETGASMLGYEVVRRSNTPSPPISNRYGQLRAESLIAPSLGCLVMDYKLIMTYHDGSERTVRWERVVDVRQGEPEDALFDVPPDYVEMSPVERLTALGRSTDFSNDQILQGWERTYRERQGL